MAALRNASRSKTTPHQKLGHNLSSLKKDESNFAGEMIQDAKEFERLQIHVGLFHLILTDGLGLAWLLPQLIQLLHYSYFYKQF